MAGDMLLALLQGLTLGSNHTHYGEILSCIRDILVTVVNSNGGSGNDQVKKEWSGVFYLLFLYYRK